MSRELEWMGDSKKVLRSFPDEVKREIGVALFEAQVGGKSPLAKHFTGIAPGIFEIVCDFNTDTYRAVYAVKIGEEIYVLHAFQKKSKTGRKTPQKEVNLIKSRYRDAIELEKSKRA